MSTEPEPRATEDLVARLVQLDEELAERSLLGTGSTAAADETIPHDLADAAACLEVFQRVRQQAPQAVEDLLQEEPVELSWLETEDGQPQRLGRFAIQRRLGSGGFGVVFLARDPDLDRDVALKVPRVEALVSEDLQRRFLHEARAAAGLNHANIAAVYEVGQAGPICYISSAVCNGGTLRELLGQTGGRLPPRSAARLITTLAEAVQHAHSRGILHRDIKPGNVLLDLEPGAAANAELAEDARQLSGVARLVDFGLARDLASADQHTRSGVPLGTPAYMAPEQAVGARDQVGPAADVYALGATLYHLLAGEPPIKKDSDVATLQAVATEQPRSLRRLRPDVPADLDAICLKCLEKQPNQRYASASALAEDLQRFLDGVPVRARPVSVATRLTRWCARNPALAASLGLLLAVLTVGVVTSSTLWLQADAARRDSEAKKTLADEKAAAALKHARHSREAVQSLLAGIAEEPLIRSEGMEKFRRRLLDSAAKYYQEVQAENPQDPDVLKEYVNTLQALATMHRLLGDLERAVEIWKSAADLAGQVPQGSGIAVASLWAAQADDLITLGRFEEAIALTRQAVKLVRESDDGTDPAEQQQSLIKMLVAAAQVLHNNGEPTKAEELIDEALELGSELTDKPPTEWPAEVQLARTIRCKTEVCSSLSQDDVLPAYAAAAIRMFENIQQQDPSRSSMCLDSIASMHKALGLRHSRRQEYAAAQQEYQLEREFIEQLVMRHPDVGFLAHNLANNAYRTAVAMRADGRLDEALSHIENQLEWLAAQQAQFPDLKTLLQQTEIYLLHTASSIHRHQDRLAEGTAHLQTAIGVCENVCAGPQQPLHMVGTLGNLYSDLASVYLKENRLELAAATFEQAIAALQPVAERAPASEAGSYLITTYVNYANLLEQLEQHQQALEFADRVLAAAPPAAAGDAARRLRVRSFVQLGEYETARKEYEDAASDGGLNIKDTLTWARCAARAASITATINGDQAQASTNYFIDAGLRMLDRATELGAFKEDGVREQLLAEEELAILRTDPRFAASVGEAASDDATE